MQLHFTSNKIAYLVTLVTFLSAIFLFKPSHISTNMLDIFPKDRAIKQLEDISKFSTLNQLLVLSDGFDNSSKDALDDVAKALKKNSYISQVYLKQSHLDDDVKTFLQTHYIERIDIADFDQNSIDEKLQKLYDNMQSAFLFTPIDKKDPFKLINDPLLKQQSRLKDGYAYLPKKGYLLRASVNFAVSDIAKAKAFYQQMERLQQRYPHLTFYAPHFFSAQNSTKIKSQINRIIAATTLLLLLFYFVTLKDAKTLILSSLALASSVFVALSFTTALFDKVSVFTLAFGSGIAMMSIDYFFHYYFLGYYRGERNHRKKVFFALFTTTLGLTLMLFAHFSLIQQLAFFGIVALSFSYFIFTFVYANIAMAPKTNRIKLHVKHLPLVDAKIITAISLTLIGFGLYHIKLDTVLAHLDYQNKELKATQAIFKQHSTTTPLLIYANSLDALFSTAKALKTDAPSLSSLLNVQKDFNTSQSNIAKLKQLQAMQPLIDKAATAIGFREGYFKEAYQFNTVISKHDISILNRLGFETKKIDDHYVTLAFVDKKEVQSLKNRAHVVVIEPSKMLKNSLYHVLSELLLLSAITLAVIFTIIAFIFRGNTLIVINYTLFALGLILTIISLSSALSVMHLFALIIVIVAALDYGIYMANPQPNLDEAILYAMITSFGGFGIFIFSSIGALNHIGTVITLGIVSTFILQIVQKRVKHANQ